MAKQQVELNEWCKESSVISGASSGKEDRVSKVTQELAAAGLGGANNSKALLDVSVMGGFSDTRGGSILNGPFPMLSNF